MTPATYRTHRKLLGSVPEAARILRVGERTIERRESGHSRISYEAELAMRVLTEQHEQPSNGRYYWEG